MKYIHKNTSLEVKGNPLDGDEFFTILAFIHKLFSENGKPLSQHIPAPAVKITQFHYNTKTHTGCVEEDHVIYLPQDSVGAKFHATLIVALVTYYAKASNQQDVGSEIIGNIEVKLTLAEHATTNPLVVGTIVATKNLYNKFF